MVTRYPVAIDGYAQIRAVRDRMDEIVANDHNNLRSAIIAIEQTLGINPQGPFGTVVARLNDAYSNIEAHVLGNPPRHLDTVIESPARSGTYHSLSAGTVGSQIEGLLAGVNDPLYGGSGSKTFADGYALPASYLKSAIGEIVNEIGGSTGATKVGQSTFSFYKHDFTGTDVASHILDAGSFIEEQSLFLERAFDSFVVEGMSVSQSGGGPNADIAAGFIASNGRLLYYPGGTLSVALTGTCYIYARISAGSVSVRVATSVDTCVDNIEPAVILHKFTTAGGAWSDSVDLRRFGMFVNNKNYLTVGNAPTYGSDGYGCDFISLKSAVEYVKSLSTSAEKISSKKILLTNDLTISTANEMAILLDVDGIEIDGGDCKIITSVDAPLFYIEANNINIHNLQLDMDIDVSLGAPIGAGLANINTLSSSPQTLSGINIENCNLTYSDTYAATYFLKIGYIASDTNKTTLSSFINNRALVADAGICFSHISATTSDVLTNSIITGNNIYQDDFSLYSSTGMAIYANASCIIADNIISGGFYTGIAVDNGLGSVISNNKIEGSYIGTAYMNVGILCQNSSATNSDMVILNNSISGQISTGIDMSSNMIGAIISNNLIDNSGLIAGFTGILGYGTDDFVIGNSILRIGDYGVRNAKYVLDNVITGDISITSTTAGILFKLSSPYGMACNNFMYGISGAGIDCNYNDYMLVKDNLLYGQIGATTGISHVRSYSNASGNLINNFGVSAGYGISTSASTVSTVISNNIIIPAASMSAGIYLVGTREIFVLNNIIGNYSNQLPKVGINAGPVDNCMLVGNYCYGATNGAAFNLITGAGANSIIMGNMLYGANNIGITLSGSDVICSNNYIANSYGIGIFCINRQNLVINGNIFSNVGSDAINIDTAPYSSVCNNQIISTGANGIVVTSSDNILISSNYISNIYGIGISSFASNCLEINGNYLYNVCTGPASDGMGIGAGCYNLSVSNNTVNTFDGIAFNFAGVTDSVFVGNNCYNPTVSSDGMDLTGCANCLLVGNYCYGGSNSGKTGFIVDGTANMSATANFARGNTIPNNFRNGIMFDGYTCRYIS